MMPLSLMDRHRRPRNLLRAIFGCDSWSARRMRWAGHVARMGDRRNAYWVLMVRPEGKTSLGRLGRPGLRWEDNIKMDLKEVGWRGMD